MATSYLLETMYALTAYNATILYATTAPVFPESRIVENRPRRVRHVLATILLQQIDRPLLAEQRALLNEPKPRAPRIARDLQHIADPLHGPSVNELLERERMFARARQKRDNRSEARRGGKELYRTCRSR